MKQALAFARSRTQPVRRERPNATGETEGSTSSTGPTVTISSSAHASSLPEPPGTAHWNGPVPVRVEDLGDGLPYHSRRNEVKVAVHWGQRKLLMSEVQLLTPGYGVDGFRRGYDVVYVGSAPGDHLLYLDSLFEHRHRWILVDPGAFVLPLRNAPNVTIRNEFFTNAVAYELFVGRLESGGLPGLARLVGLAVHHAQEEDRGAQCVAQQARERQAAANVGDIDTARAAEAVPTMCEPRLHAVEEGLVGLWTLARAAAAERRPMLFVSDVRTGTAEMSNFDEHIVENMAAQANWVRIVDPAAALLKYRLPYASDRCPLPKYLSGDVLLPIWGPQTTTECRLLVRPPFVDGPTDPALHEKRLFYLNAALRERTHFNHELSPHLELDNRFDSAAEIDVWKAYLSAAAAADSPVAASTTVADLVNRTTGVLRETFEDVRRKRDTLLSSQAVGAGTRGEVRSTKRYRPEDAAERRSRSSLAAPTMADFLQARSKPVWWRNATVSRLGHSAAGV